jgi:hypothetical protein
VDFDGKGKVVVMGDFNSRVGELPNILNSREAAVTISRCSEDKMVNAEGRLILEALNAVGMVLLNGVGERARCTREKSVLDFVGFSARNRRMLPGWKWSMRNSIG